MLVVSRKDGQKLKLIERTTGEVIATVTIVTSRLGRVSVGVDAIESIKILRSELELREEDRKVG